MGKKKCVELVKANKLININNYKYFSLYPDKPSAQERGTEINRINASGKIA